MPSTNDIVEQHETCGKGRGNRQDSIFVCAPGDLLITMQDPDEVSRRPLVRYRIGEIRLFP